MKELKIPSEHLGKFKNFLDLDATLKNKLLDILKNIPQGTSPQTVIEIVEKELVDLNKNQINDFAQIYFNLIRTKESLKIDTEDFLARLSYTLKKTGIAELNINESQLNDFRELLNANPALSLTTKIIESITDNSKIFLGVNLHEDIRPIFDDQDNYLASGIFYNLKIRYRENDESFDFFVALDDNDLDRMVKALKKSQDRVKAIKEKLTGDSIVVIK